MADNRPRLEKYLGMLGSDQMGERAAAALKISELAKAEKKSIVELCMGPQPAAQQHRQESDFDPFRRHRRQSTGGFADDLFREMERQAQARREANARAAADRAEREQGRKQQYNGAFDDAEMSDADRQAAREKKAQARRARAGMGMRKLLDDLAEAYSQNDGDIESWEEEFAASVPHQYRFDYELSAKQERTARMIIAKIRRNQGESPI